MLTLTKTIAGRRYEVHEERAADPQNTGRYQATVEGGYLCTADLKPRNFVGTPPGTKPHDAPWTPEEVLEGVVRAVHGAMVSRERKPGEAFPVNVTSYDLYEANGKLGTQRRVRVDWTVGLSEPKPDNAEVWEAAIERAYGGKYGYVRLVTAGKGCWHIAVAIPLDAPYLRTALLRTAAPGVRGQFGFSHGGPFRTMLFQAVAALVRDTDRLVSCPNCHEPFLALHKMRFCTSKCAQRWHDRDGRKLRVERKQANGGRGR